MIEPNQYGRHSSVEWAAGIRPERQVWLWENRIPVGTVAALAGRGGTGKTTYALHLAAQLSRGELPGEHLGTPRPTLMWSGEDAWGPVLVPRLIAAGADLNMIGRLAIASTEVDGEVSPRLPLDVEPMRTAINDTGAALLIIDPIASVMSGDLHREADVRVALDALARLAVDTGTVIMFVRHFGKGGGNASDKMSGSHAFRDACRAVFLFAEHEDSVIVSQDKGNYAPRGEASFAYRLDSVTIPTDDGPAQVARIVDLGASDVSVSDVINQDQTESADPDARTEAERWLSDYLTDRGVIESAIAKRDASKIGIKERTLKRAASKLGVQVSSKGFPRVTHWSLPTGDSRDSQDTSTLGLGTTGPTVPTVHDQRKRNGPTERNRQAGQPASAGLTSDESAAYAPLCIVCGQPVTAGQGDRHLSCTPGEQSQQTEHATA